MSFMNAIMTCRIDEQFNYFFCSCADLTRVGRRASQTPGNISGSSHVFTHLLHLTIFFKIHFQNIKCPIKREVQYMGKYNLYKKEEIMDRHNVMFYTNRNFSTSLINSSIAVNKNIIKQQKKGVLQLSLPQSPKQLVSQFTKVRKIMKNIFYIYL